MAAGLATVYGARERPLGDLALEVVLAATVGVVVVGIVPLALALSRSSARLTAIAVGLASAGAGAIHFAVIRDHLDEYWFYGLFFIVTALIQLVWATAIVVRPTTLLLALGIVVNAGIIASWVVTRTVGLLIGPSADEVEPVALADALATGFEAAIVLGALFLVVRDAKRHTLLPPRRAEALIWLLALVTAGATTLGLLSAIGAAPGVLPPAA
jgi:hypothetical protein